MKKYIEVKNTKSDSVTISGVELARGESRIVSEYSPSALNYIRSVQQSGLKVRIVYKPDVVAETPAVDNTSTPEPDPQEGTAEPAPEAKEDAAKDEATEAPAEPEVVEDKKDNKASSETPAEESKTDDTKADEEPADEKAEEPAKKTTAKKATNKTASDNNENSDSEKA